MKNIIHKHDSYCVIQPNQLGIKYFMVYTNGDFLDNMYPIKDGDIPEIFGYSKEELQVLFENFQISKFNKRR